ncbi:hypothetical protein AAFM49_28195 [Burkholderia pseudomallei]|uniref:hypothetical protein n=1 Tax=Burkholderia pseudomallei TaxID=28450 RepID=UPI0018A1CD71|nr:hypothetical protein [Burkholderia pseudomallei]
MPARDAARAGQTTGLARIKAWCCATGGPRRGAERRTPNAGRTAMRDARCAMRHPARAMRRTTPAPPMRQRTARPHRGRTTRRRVATARAERASGSRIAAAHRSRASQPRIAAITRFTAGARTPAGRRRFEQAPARSATLRPDAARLAPPSRAGRPLANSPAESAD